MVIITSKIYKALFLLFIVVIIGVVGYSAIADFSFVDALYMTIITISTVGFGEVQALDENSKLFTIILILMSISIYGYVISVISEYISNDSLMEEIKAKKQQKKIDSLKNHTIVCGYGRNGKQAVVKLKNYNTPCVVIEKDKELIKKLEEEEILFVEGDATDDASLEKAGLKNSGSLIATLPSDANNLYVVLSARQMNDKVTIVSRATNESTQNKLKIAGADNVIMPDKIGGDHMASLVVTPDLVEFVNRISVEGESTANLEEIAVNKLPKEYLKKSIRDLDLRKKTGCSVIGFITANEEYIINPDAEIQLEPNSNLIVLGSPEQIVKLKKLF